MLAGGKKIQLFFRKRKSKVSWLKQLSRVYFVGLRELSGSNSSTTEFMQKRNPVGGGPSLKTWPKCELQRAQRTSVRSMPWVCSRLYSTAFLRSGSKKL